MAEAVNVLPDGRVDRKNAAKFLGCAPATLADWHRTDKGPPSRLVGGRRFYDIESLREFAGSPDVPVVVVPDPEPVKKTAENAIGKGKAGPGRPKGLPNKTTALLKDAILQAAADAGGEGGLIGYLTLQATANPSSFLPLLGKVLPMQVTGEDGGPVKYQRIELVPLAGE